MEIMYPVIIILTILVLIFIIIYKSKTKMKYKDGTKIANTKYVKQTDYYKQIYKKYRKLLYSFISVLIICILLSSLLVSRITIEETSTEELYNRDIFLCLDVSTSVDKLNKELVSSLKKIVNNLKGERFGISIFNTTSVLLVPLTDDYDYVLDVLDQMEEAFNKRIKPSLNDEYYITDYIESGTMVGGSTRGGSIIGDGLASCIYNFPNLEEVRSRVIIFSTDNDLYGDPLISFDDASSLAKENNITVYGIAPSLIKNDDKEEFKENVEKTGGYLYIQDEQTVDSIVNSIEQKEKSLMKGKIKTRRIDKPETLIILLTISLTCLFILSRKVKL